MSYRETVKNLIMQSPILFPNALAVANHLFYVVGNGTEWNNGELVESYLEDNGELSICDYIYHVIKSSNYPDLHELRDNILCGLDDEKAVRFIYSDLLTNRALSMMDQVRIIMNADKLAEDYSIPADFPERLPFEFYPICPGYSKSTIMPDDIKPDWKEAIEKVNKIRNEYENK